MLYDKIKELCKEKNITIYRLEKEMDFSSGSIRKWSKSVPAADKLQKVAEYLGVPMTLLMCQRKEGD